MEYVVYYDMDEEGNKRELRMVGRKILKGKRTKCYKKMRQPNVLWDNTRSE